MTDIAIKGEISLDSAYKTALRLLEDSYKTQQIFTKVPKIENSLSWFEPLCIPAMEPVARKEIVSTYLLNEKIFNIAIVGIFAWAIINVLNDYNAGERAAFEEYFVKREEYFDSITNTDGLFSTGIEENWLKSVNRQGILIENQAYYGKILDILFLLTNDDVYEFKKSRLIRAVRAKLDGAYVLDREGFLEIRPNYFIASFLAPELFTRDEWMKAFDVSLKNNKLWLDWGGFVTLGKSDPNYNAEKDSGSWFFINNMAGLSVYRMDNGKYADKVQKILDASAKNILWQKYSGRPCEVMLTENRQIKVQGLYGISLATFIYLYRVAKSI